MITALISALTGILGGAIPDLLKEWTASRQSKRERDFLELQNNLQIAREKAGADAKMREADMNAVVAEVGAFKDSLKEILAVQGLPTGVAWIDGFNAVLRPLCCLCVIALFMVTAVVYMQSVIGSYNMGVIKSSTELANVIWSSMIGESVQAVLGYLFGYRSVVAKR